MITQLFMKKIVKNNYYLRPTYVFIKLPQSKIGIFFHVYYTYTNMNININFLCIF